MCGGILRMGHVVLVGLLLLAPMVVSALNGTVQKITFAGPVTSNSVTFSLYP